MPTYEELIISLQNYSAAILIMIGVCIAGHVGAWFLNGILNKLIEWIDRMKK
jgi:hypothetical protein